MPVHVHAASALQAMKSWLELTECAVQVHLHYGPYDNGHLLIYYGFVLPDNPNDSISISVKV